MAIGLSHGGSNVYSSASPSTEVLVGTLDGVAILQRDGDGPGWHVAHRALTDRHVSSIIVEPESGMVFAGSFGGGVHASADDGRTWERRDDGIAYDNVFSLAHARLNGRVRIFAGTEPAHLYYSDDLGLGWTELSTMRSVESVEQWNFPAPPHIAHTKFIAFDPHDPTIMYACIEQGALLKSVDSGENWREINEMGLYKDSNRPSEIFYDIHKLLIDPRDTEKMFVTGGAGLYVTEDGGGHWERRMAPGWAPDVYPDGLVMHPRQPDLMFIGAAEHNPATWRHSHFAGGRIFRSTDAGRTFEVLRDGLPDRMRQEVGALCLEDWGESCSIFAATTGGEVYASEDGGDHWSLIADGLTPVSKGGHHAFLAAAATA